MRGTRAPAVWCGGSPALSRASAAITASTGLGLRCLLSPLSSLPPNATPQRKQRQPKEERSKQPQHDLHDLTDLRERVVRRLRHAEEARCALRAEQERARKRDTRREADVPEQEAEHHDRREERNECTKAAQAVA